MAFKKLETTPLPNAKLELPPLTLGTWAFAKDRIWGAQDDQVSLRTIACALDAGLSSFDSAPGYGNGEAERVLGRGLKGKRDQAVIATKVSPSEAAGSKCIASCEASLERLGTDYIDLLQMHWPNHDVPFEETVEALQKLKKEGKIRHYGVCNFGPKDMSDWMKTGGEIATNQIAYSLLARAVEFELLPFCSKHGIGVLPYSPLMQGLLTGKFHHPDEVPATRARSRHFHRERPDSRHGEEGCEKETFESIDKLRNLSAESGVPMAHLALAWLIRQPAVSSLVVGARDPEQLEKNIAAMHQEMDRSLINAVEIATEPVKQKLGANPDMWEASGRIR